MAENAVVESHTKNSDGTVSHKHYAPLNGHTWIVFICCLVLLGFLFFGYIAFMSLQAAMHWDLPVWEICLVSAFAILSISTACTFSFGLITRRFSFKKSAEDAVDVAKKALPGV